MTTLGQTLQEARKQKGVTASEAAAATHIKVQHIADIERNVFDKIAAPAYAKGFIKLYAEYLGLDPTPLVRDYVDHYAPKHKKSLWNHDETQPASDEQKQGKPRIWTWPIIKGHLKRARWWGGGILLILLMVLSFSRCAVSPQKPETRSPVKVDVEPTREGLIPLPPPAPYLDLD